LQDIWGRGLTLYIKIIHGSKMSLFRFSLAFLCMVHRSIGEGGLLGGYFQSLGSYSPPNHPRAATGGEGEHYNVKGEVNTV